ncbi:PAS domain S-box protein [Catenovulum sediminis]|uniref:PAS domain S-box protein n=1 Tax=Catenovulum sediminis TaxID=1740262 RepID=UPI00163D5466|nr:PAS domain S-box protein [Catenovulum sediminis]
MLKEFSFVYQEQQKHQLDISAAAFTKDLGRTIDGALGYFQLEASRYNNGYPNRTLRKKLPESILAISSYELHNQNWQLHLRLTSDVFTDYSLEQNLLNQDIKQTPVYFTNWASDSGSHEILLVLLQLPHQDTVQLVTIDLEAGKKRFLNDDSEIWDASQQAQISSLRERSWLETSAPLRLGSGAEKLYIFSQPLEQQLINYPIPVAFMAIGLFIFVAFAWGLQSLLHHFVVARYEKKYLRAKQANALFEGYLEHLEAPVSIQDSTGKILYVNNAWSQLTKLSREQVLNKYYFDVEKVAQSTNRKTLEQLGGDYTHFSQREFTVDIASSKQKTFLGSKFPLYNHSAELLAHGEIYLDISAQKSQEVLFSTIFNYTVSGAAIVDKNRFIKVNPRMLELYQQTDENFFYDKHFFSDELTFENEGQHSLGWQYLSQAESNNRLVSFEWACTRDGQKWYSEISLIPIVLSGEKRFLYIQKDITEYKQQIQSLHAIQQQLSSVFSTLPVGVGVFSATGSYLRSNELFNQILAVDTDKLADFNLSSVNWQMQDLDGRPLQYQDCPVYKIYHGQYRVRSYELGVVNLAGELQWLEMNCAALPDEIGGGIVIVIKDIAPQKRAREQLEKSERILSRSQALAKTGGWEFDKTSEKLYWSDEVFRIFETPVLPENLAPEYCLKCFLADSKTKVFKAFANCLENGIPFDITAQLETYAGHILWVRTTGEAVYAKNKVIGAVGNIADVSITKEAEIELFRSKQRLELAIQGGNIGIWDFELETEKLYVSEIWCQMLGYSRAELFERYGKNCNLWRMLIHPDDEPIAEQAFYGHVEGALDLYQAKFRLKTASGDWKWIRTVGKFVKAQRFDEKDRAMGIHIDIDAAKQEERNLLEAKSQAEQAAISKSEFLANMSHEIRTPLNAIIGMTQLALTGELEAKQRNYIEKVNHSGLHLLSIVNDILDFSKIESGQLTIETVQFNLAEVIENVKTLVLVKAQEKNTNLVFRIAPDVPLFLLGDPLRLCQILVNIIDNAIKFSEQNTPVWLEVTHQGAEPERQLISLSFSIKDNGIGMNDAQKTKLFKSFSQADTSITRRFGGTGLGLVISKNLVEMMQGDISFISEQGKGTEFTIELPFELDRSTFHRRANQIEYAFANTKVLIVSHDDALKSHFCQVFADEKMGTIELADLSMELPDVLHSLNGTKQLILLVDIQADTKGAENAIQTARKRIEAHYLKGFVFVLTDTEQSSDNMHEQSAWLDGVIEKSISPSKLLSHLLEKCAALNSAAENHTINLTGKNILVAEDNLLNQELIFELLTRKGAAVTLVEDGAMAVDNVQANQDKYDLILMDCQMPKVDGLTATRQIRLLPQFKNVPILALTANILPSQIEEAKSAGMNDCIGKPIVPEKLYEQLAKWLSLATVVDTTVEKENGQNNLNWYQFLRSDEELNAEKGLSGALGDYELYKRLLVRFFYTYENFESDFTSLISNQDREQAIRLAHTLKGTAAQIGHNVVAELAANLEQTLKQGDSDLIEEIKARLQLHLNRLLLVLNRSGLMVRSEQTKQFDSAKVLELLSEAKQLVSRYDTSAVDIIEELSTYLHGTVFETLYKVLERQINEYDFDAALSNLLELEIKLESENE